MFWSAPKSLKTSAGKSGKTAFWKAPLDAESKKPRDSKQLVEIWLDRRKKSGDSSPQKGLHLSFLNLPRDLRNGAFSYQLLLKPPRGPS